jgi:hypothetical protein
MYGSTPILLSASDEFKDTDYYFVYYVETHAYNTQYLCIHTELTLKEL